MDNEVNALGKHSHTNIVKFLHQQKDHQYHYIALELCSCNLSTFLFQRKSSDVMNNENCTEALLGLVEGLNHAHTRKVIHRDLKPENILLIPKKGFVHFEKSNQEHLTWNFWILKIADWGLSRETKGDASFPSMGVSSSKSSISGHSIIGSAGYMAPEMFHKNVKKSYASDIFGLGILLHMCLTNGDHPYLHAGQFHHDIQRNIRDGKKQSLSDQQYGTAGSCNLISQCLDPSPKKRPRASAMINHAFFWNPDKWVSFINKFANTIKADPFRHNNKIKQEFRTMTANFAVVGDWKGKISRIQLGIACDTSKYDNTIFDCLRFIRNIYQHKSEKNVVLHQMSDATFWNDIVFRTFWKLPSYVYSFVSAENNELQLGMNEYIRFFSRSSRKKTRNKGNGNKGGGRGSRSNSGRGGGKRK